MVDMGQADSTLRQKPLCMQHKMCWTRALGRAAKAMGFEHHMDIQNEDEVEVLKSLARKIQIEGDA